MQPAQWQLALVSHAGHLRTHRQFTAHAQIDRIQLYTAAACSCQSRRTSAHTTDSLLRMRKVKKFCILCSQPSGSLLSSVTRDIFAHTDILLRMRTLVEFNYILRQLALVHHAWHLRTHRHFTAHAQSGRRNTKIPQLTHKTISVGFLQNLRTDAFYCACANL